MTTKTYKHFIKHFESASERKPKTWDWIFMGIITDVYGDDVYRCLRMVFQTKENHGM